MVVSNQFKALHVAVLSPLKNFGEGIAVDMWFFIHMIPILKLATGVAHPATTGLAPLIELPCDLHVISSVGYK